MRRMWRDWKQSGGNWRERWFKPRLFQTLYRSLDCILLHIYLLVLNLLSTVFKSIIVDFISMCMSYVFQIQRLQSLLRRDICVFVFEVDVFLSNSISSIFVYSTLLTNCNSYKSWMLRKWNKTEKKVKCWTMLLWVVDFQKIKVESITVICCVYYE